MARLYDVTTGKFDQFKRVLADADLDSDLIDLIVRKPELARKWVTDLRELLKPPAPTLEGLFRTPEQIYDTFFMQARASWAFSADQLGQLYEQMPTLHKSSLTSVLTLDIWLGDLSTTFEELWNWNKSVHPAVWRYDGLKSDKKHLRLLDTTRYGTQPSVKWVELDVTANRGQAPKDVRDSTNSPGLALLAASALHPEWPRAINYDTIPGVWLPGLQATLPGVGAWRFVPILHRDDREVDLSAFWDARRHSSFAVPVSREL